MCQIAAVWRRSNGTGLRPRRKIHGSDGLRIGTLPIDPPLRAIQAGTRASAGAELERDREVGSQRQGTHRVLRAAHR